MPRVEIRRRKFSIRAEVYDHRTGAWHTEEFLATGKARISGAEAEFKRWCWAQGFVARVRSIEDISGEPDRIEIPNKPA